MREIADLFHRVADLERRLDGVVRHGSVTDVDTAKQMVRIGIGEDDDGTFKSPWVPYAQHAGAFKGHVPPTVGQNMTVFSPNGDFRQAVALPMSWNNANASPGSGSDPVWTFGSVKVELKQNEVVLTIGSTKMKLTGEKVVIEAATVETIGQTNIGLDAEGQSGPQIVTMGGPAKKATAKV